MNEMKKWMIEMRSKIRRNLMSGMSLSYNNEIRRQDIKC